MQKIRTIRRRTKWAAAILAIALLSYSVLVPAPDGRAGVLRRELAALFRPLLGAVTWVESGVSSVWAHYIHLTRVSIENDKLRSEIDRLRAELQIISETQNEGARLRALLAMAEPWGRHPIAARVIAVTPQADLRTVVIDRGWADGITRDRPVLAAGGLVGRVRVVTEHTATVLLITDSSSAVDVIDSRSRVRGLLVGALRGTELQRPVLLTQLEYVAHDSDIRQDDVLMTSGMDGVYPKGLPVGRVHDLRKDEFGLFEEAWVLPAVDLSRLEEVIVP
jgi:rod shape-determining protein MreC